VSNAHIKRKSVLHRFEENEQVPALGILRAETKRPSHTQSLRFPYDTNNICTWKASPGYKETGTVSSTALAARKDGTQQQDIIRTTLNCTASVVGKANLTSIVDPQTRGHDPKDSWQPVPRPCCMQRRPPTQAHG